MSLTITLGVNSLDQSEIFCREILQLATERCQPFPGHPPLLILRQEESVVLFRQLDVLESRHPALFQNLAHHPRGVGVTLEFQVPSLKPRLQAIERNGLPLLYELSDDESGWQEIWLHDPDGYLLILSESPA